VQRTPEGLGTGINVIRADPGATARAFLALFLRLRVLARSRPEEELLRDISHQPEVLLH